MPNLPSGEPQMSEPSDGVRLIAHPIPALLRGCPVILETVGLYDEAKVWPVEVDAKAVD